jgi:hypothetical protein
VTAADALSVEDAAAWLGALRRLHADEPSRDERWTALSLGLLERAAWRTGTTWLPWQPRTVSR